MFPSIDEGVHRVTGLDHSGQSVTRVHATGRVRCIQELEGLAGVVTATETGLLHSPECDVTGHDVPLFWLEDQ